MMNLKTEVEFKKNPPVPPFLRKGGKNYSSLLKMGSFKTKPNGQVSSLPFWTTVLSSTQLDSGESRNDVLEFGKIVHSMTKKTPSFL